MKTMIISLFICVNGFAQMDVVGFFDLLYSENEIKIENTYKDNYNLFCYQYGIDKNNTHNKDIFYKLYFMHRLFTTDSAMDCSNSGLLEIPYFWDDTRQYISGNEYDIKRTPDVFLSDLVSNKPQYSYECEDINKWTEFYTFGWCSEREMAFVALLRNMGYDADIIALDGHAWTQVYVPMYVNDYKEMYTITIDNTFDKFYVYEERLPCMHTCSQYDYNCSICLMIEYYNPAANKPIDDIIIFESAMERINELVISKLN